MYTLFKAIFRFCTFHKIFVYLKRRYDNTQVRTLNNIIKIKGKIRTLQHAIEFLEECLSQRIVPKSIACSITRSRAKTSVHVEKAFLRDKRYFKITKLAAWRRHYR